VGLRTRAGKGIGCALAQERRWGGRPGRSSRDSALPEVADATDQSGNTLEGGDAHKGSLMAVSLANLTKGKTRAE